MHVLADSDAGQGFFRVMLYIGAGMWAIQEDVQEVRHGWHREECRQAGRRSPLLTLDQVAFPAASPACVPDPGSATGRDAI